MYNELSEERLKQVTKITNTNYGELQLNDNAYSLIEDLLDTIEHDREEFKNYKQRIESGEEIEF